jgi:hypothetical protein
MKRPHRVHLNDFDFEFSERVPETTVAHANGLLASLKQHMPRGKGIDERAVMGRLGELEAMVNSLI